MPDEANSRRAKGDRVGEIRCQNCFARFWPAQGAEKAVCPECGLEWYISWAGDLAKIRKPVWESWARQTGKPHPAEE